MAVGNEKTCFKESARLYCSVLEVCCPPMTYYPFGSVSKSGWTKVEVRASLPIDILPRVRLARSQNHFRRLPVCHPHFSQHLSTTQTHRTTSDKMADRGRGGGFGDRGRGDRGRGDRGRGDRGRGRGRGGPRRGGGKQEEKEWQPVTKLGRLVKAGKIQSMEQIYLHSLPIKEYQIVDWFLPKLKDEVMKVSILLCVIGNR